MLLFAWLLAWQTPFVEAKSVDTVYLHRLMRARSGAEVEQVRTQYESLKTARLACRMQVKNNQAPVSCYEALADEKSWGLLDPEKYRKLLLWLEELCAKSAHQLAIPETLDSQRLFLSAPCRSRLEEARRRREYKQGPQTSWPTN